MPNRKIAPQYKISENITLPEINHLKLDNEVVFHHIPRGIDDAITLIINFHGGSWIQNKRLVSRITTKTLAEGTRNKSSAEIAEILNYHAVDIGYRSGNHANFIKIMLLRKHLPIILPLLNEILTYPAFPEKEIRQYLANEKQNYIIELEEVELVARNEFYKAVFGYNHPYGTYALPEDYDKITIEDLKNFHSRVFGYNNLSIWAAGKLSDKDISLINKHLTLIHPAEKISFYPKPITPEKEKLIRIKKNNSLQNAIYIGNSTITTNHPDFLALQFVIIALGGYFSSRLMTNIREEKGLTYGIYSYLDTDRMGSTIVIEASVKKENTDLVLEEINKEINKLQKNGLDKEELLTVKNYLLGNMLKLIDGPYALAYYLNRVYNLGLDENIIYNHIREIKNISNEKIIEIAHKYLKFEDFYKVIVG